MQQHTSKKEKLDKIGRALLESSAMTNEELEKIVSGPRLFSAVQARIEAERQKAAAAPVKKPIFAAWNWQIGSAAFAGAVIVLAVILGLAFSTRRENFADVAQIDPPAQMVGVQEIAQEPKQIRMPAGLDNGETEFKPVEVVYSERAESKAAAKKVVRRVKLKRAAQDHSPAQFYPLTYTGLSDETSIEAQVVRVEVPRASLYAMGVDLPLGNGTDTVKTELLISSDGVTQGIRIVE
jgi:hypothetical protein